MSLFSGIVAFSSDDAIFDMPIEKNKIAEPILTLSADRSSLPDSQPVFRADRPGICATGKYSSGMRMHFQEDNGWPKNKGALWA